MLKLAVPYGGIFILCMTFTAFCIGPLAHVLIKTHYIPFPSTPDKVLPVVLSELFPPWVTFLFLFGILAAAMSTASALIHTAGASVGRDVYQAGKSLPDEKKSIFVTRFATTGIVIATLILPLSPPDVVAFMCAFFFGLMAGTFLAVYTLLLYWQKISKAGAWAGILGGFVFILSWYIFVYFKTSPVIFGRSLVAQYQINMLYPLFIAMPLSFILTYVVSIIIKPTPKEEKIGEEVFKDISSPNE